MTNRVTDSQGLSSQEIASELNNLLQIISGTTGALENIWEGRPEASRYFEMLRESVARATDVTTDLVERSGRLTGKVVFPGEFSQSKPPQVAATPTPKKKIMIVDDEKMLLILTGESLKEAGYEVVTAQSGFECLDRFQNSSERFDLVLLDLNMPLMDGEETFQRLRAMQPELRVMLCTGFVAPERLSQMLAQGLSGFVQKPLGPRAYLESVRNALALPPLSPNESFRSA